MISDETWTAAQDALTMARKLPRQASGEFPLTGLLRCFRCGSRMGGTRPTRRGRSADKPDPNLHLHIVG